MRRCRATAAAIGKPFDRAPVVLEELNDIDYGKWQGLTPDQAKAHWPDELSAWYRRPDWAAIPNGDTLQDLLARSVAALRKAITEHPGATVVMVGHDSVNRVILLHALELPLSRYWQIRQDPCAINQLDFTEDGFIVASVNQTDHLLDT